MKNKRGISTIMATTLIVILTISAVYIFWKAVEPTLHIPADYDGSNEIPVIYNRDYIEEVTVIGYDYSTHFDSNGLKIEDYFIEDYWLNEDYNNKLCELLVEEDKESILNQSDLLFIYVWSSHVVEEPELAELTSAKIICEYDVIWDIEKISEGTLKFDKWDYIATIKKLNVSKFNYSKVEVKWNPEYEEYTFKNNNKYYDAKIKIKLVEK